MRTIRLINRDLKLGTAKNWYKYVLSFILTSFICFSVYKTYMVYILEYNALDNKISVLDYFLHVVPGIPIYHYSKGDNFQLPVYWFTFQILIHYIVAYYPTDDFSSYGKVILPASNRRGNWWIGKCVWCIVSVVIHYALMILAVIIMTVVMGGEIAFRLDGEVISYYGLAATYINEWDALLIALAVPFAVTVSLCLFHVFLSFIISPVMSFAIICALYIMSAYYHVWWLPGSFTMWCRSSYIVSEGYTPQTAFIFAGYLACFSIVMGKIYLDKKDVL